MDAAAPNIYYPGGNVNLPEKLAEALEPLRASHLPIARWTPAALLEEFLTMKHFIRSVKIVTSIGDAAVRDELCKLGIQGNFWDQNHLCTPLQFYRFCKWLRTPDGAEGLRTVQKRISLRKKARKRKIAELDKLVQLLNYQLSDLSQARKGRIAEIAELRRQLAMKQAELDRLDAEYRPASDYKALDEQAMTRLCVERYEEECQDAGKDMAPRTDEELLEVGRTKKRRT
ncbi:hypothetical protein OIU85_027105 [Salix viminalis]|uniref:Uncharacterized protein n=1 Tax=Salix viminalis TaxID=40686 RepID=A0A9Q0S9D4_SALVM|nr:hypothetical protein OIU85_027105 [Salix viminalis]